MIQNFRISNLVRFGNISMKKYNNDETFSQFTYDVFSMIDEIVVGPRKFPANAKDCADFCYNAFRSILKNSDSYVSLRSKNKGD